MMWMIILFCHVTLWTPSVESCTLLRFTNIYELLMSFIFWEKKKVWLTIIKKKMCFKLESLSKKSHLLDLLKKGF